MSTDTVNLYNEQKKTLIESSAFSEPAVFPGPVEINGIFDNQHLDISRDSGHVDSSSNQPRFIVNERPDNIVAGQTVIEIRSIEYKIKKISDPDDNGYTTLYLQRYVAPVLLP